MQDEPRPPEILAAVARYLREVVAPETRGHVNFNVRVCANALEMMRRQLELSPAAEAAEHDGLKALLGMDGDLLSLNAELSRPPLSATISGGPPSPSWPSTSLTTGATRPP
jgi:hypothetical protein